MASDTLEIASRLAAARIQALGGAPLSEAMLRQCLLEALELERLQSPVRTGIADDQVRAQRLAEVGEAVRSELAERALEGQLPAGPPAPRTRL